MYGADSDELRTIAENMFQAADDLDSDQGFLSNTLLGVPWLGGVASTFIERWTGVCVPNVNQSTEFLRECGENLNRQATEQDEASSNNGGSTAGGIGAPTGGNKGGSTSGGTGGSAADGTCESGNGDWKEGEEREGDCTQDGPQETTDWDAPSGDAEARGRAVIDQALRDTNDSTLIAKDEFEIVELENGKYIVVVPGVTDLSSWGDWIGDKFSGDSPLDWDPTHRSVRDMDKAAVASAGNTDIGENLYAQYVIQQMKDNIPPGADVMLVGHSYGGDTVMDLANDPSFNGGPNGYNVTHVVAAAYNTDGQWGGIPSSTQVLSLQNTGDAVVGMEHYTEGISQAKYGAGQVWDGIGSLDPGKVASGLGNVFSGAGSTAADLTGFGIPSMADAIPRTTNHGDGHNNITFWGGTGKDIGHDPSRYADYVSGGKSGVVSDFSKSVTESGYDGKGTRVVYDVTVD